MNDHVITFSRVGSPWYIEIALRNARLHCPGCRIVHHHNSTSGVGWDDAIDLSDVFEATQERLRTISSLIGPNDLDFQIASLARWSMLLAWMEKESVGEVCFCDSDVLLFSSPWESPHYRAGSEHVSLNEHGRPHAGNSIITTEAVRFVVDFIDDRIEKADRPRGSFRDLCAWGALVDSGGFEISNQNQVMDGVAWDHHMGWLGGEWEDDGTGYKNVLWIDQQPHCLHIPTGKLVRLVNLHCWGDAEPKMGSYALLGGMTCDNS